MARYTVEHVCGHTQDINLFGKHKDRDGRLARMRAESCPACLSKTRREAITTRAAEIRDSGLDSSWAKLQGTERQVEWAITIRVAKLTPVVERAIVAESSLDDPETTDAQRVIVDKWLRAVNWLQRCEQASWWIEARDDGADGLLRRAMDSLAAEIQAEAEAAKQATQATQATKKETEIEKTSVYDDIRETFRGLGSEPLGTAVRINVWKAVDGERRVYFGSPTNKRDRFAIVYVDGNQYHERGEVDADHEWFVARRELIKVFAMQLARSCGVISVVVPSPAEAE